MSTQPEQRRFASGVLLFATFAIAVSGLIYELVAGTVSSYLIGDSVLSFSLVIGLFMSAMGIGSYLARFITNTAQVFVIIQVVLALVGGFSALAMFLAYGYSDNFTLLLFSLCIFIGTLIGLEIPLVIQLLNEQQLVKISVSNVLTADYIGALVAAVAFPVLLVPLLGLPQSALLFGAINWLVALLCGVYFRARLQRHVWVLLAVAIVMLFVGSINANKLVTLAEAQQHQHEVVFSETTPYQRLNLTKSNDDQRFRFFINGALQFDSVDEHRYHESLVFPAILRHPNPRRILVLGGGDGLVIKQLLKVKTIEHIDLVDLDPRVIELFSQQPDLRKINDKAFDSDKVKSHAQDAWVFASEMKPLSYDVIISDLPDPRNIGLSKLYAKEMYQRLFKGLRRDGLFVTQATSPVFASEAFWMIAKTIGEAAPDMVVKPYHAYVPSFGDWGFVMAGEIIAKQPIANAPDGLRFYKTSQEAAFFEFPDDMRLEDETISTNSIFSHKLPTAYNAGWDKWFSK